MVKGELDARAGQEISLISAQNFISDDALSNQKRPWLETNAWVLQAQRAYTSPWGFEFLNFSEVLRF